MSKRFFEVDVGACVSYSIVATTASEAWALFGAHVRDSGAGEDMLDDTVTMLEIDAAEAAEKIVYDEDAHHRLGPGVREHPLTEAELGAVFCSEF